MSRISKDWYGEVRAGTERYGLVRRGHLVDYELLLEGRDGLHVVRLDAAHVAWFGGRERSDHWCE